MGCGSSVATEAKNTEAPASAETKGDKKTVKEFTAKLGFSGRAVSAKPIVARQKKPAGLVVTESLNKATQSCKKLVEKIRAHYKKTGNKFTDASFPHKADSIWKDPQNKDPNLKITEPKGWRRATDIFGTDSQLLQEPIKPSDVVQGGIGTCYLLGTLSALATKPGLLASLFVDYDLAAGVIGVRFFYGSKWVSVIIDDYLPVNGKGQPIYSHNRDKKQLWVGLIEKAYAKLYGSYEAINNGQERTAMEDLVGGAGFTVDIFKADDDSEEQEDKNVDNGLPASEAEDPWDVLRKATEENFVGTVSHTSSQHPLGSELSQGLVAGHSYTLLRFATVGGTDIVQLLNPWGGHEWKGAWADGSKEWTESALQQLDYKFADDGTFWMCKDDFVKYFTHADICKVFNDTWRLFNTWTSVPNDNEETGAHGFTLTTSSDLPVFITVNQTPDTWLRSDKNICVGLLVYEYENREEMEKGENWNIVGGVKRQYERSITCRIDTSKDKVYTLVPDFRDATDSAELLSELTVTINVYTVGSAELEEMNWSEEYAADGEDEVGDEDEAWEECDPEEFEECEEEEGQQDEAQRRAPRGAGRMAVNNKGG